MWQDFSHYTDHLFIFSDRIYLRNSFLTVLDHFVEQACLKLRDPLASDSGMLGLNAPFPMKPYTNLYQI